MSDRPGLVPGQSQGAARLDSFPYRHRVADVMRGPVVAVPPETSLAEASRTMIRERVGSLIVTDAEGTARGIATERDFLRALAEMGPGAADAPISRIMSSPVATTPEDSFLFVAFGRMPRLGVNHLLAVDARGHPVGMISASALMRLRSTEALVIGDEIAVADGAAALANVWRRIPSLVGALREEGVEGLGLTAVISAILRETTARAAELAEQSMADAGWGAAPAPWCVLVLGSGGRGESALTPDQDNAIVHAGGDSDDAWFAEAGRRIAEILDQAGIPLCKGGVMAKNAAWRRSLSGWRQEVERWIRRKEGEELLNVDIFFDFAPVYGDRALASELRGHAVDAASRSPLFLRLLAAELDNMHSALGLFGILRTQQGRFDIKRGGFLPIVTAARVMALKHGVDAPATSDRLTDLAARGALNAEDAANLARAYNFLIHRLLDQQTADIAAGVKPSTRVDPRRLHPALKTALRSALRLTDLAADVVRGALSRG
jgi:signal-transduction protein with cAMP-binding, CBS, and nucleotidyltransferase domain